MAQHMRPGATDAKYAAQAEKLRQYHEYLNANYKCGVERFFSPTGALANFQRCIKVSAKRTRDVVIAKGVDDAMLRLEPAVAGCDGVFDLVSEPGSGKTSVLPFRFASKRVVVALPTPFDAWAAYQMATGDASLKLKGLKLGSSESVCYTDSYLAANMVLSGYHEYDILIVDECDSGKGVTKFLADVRVKGKLVIRMSATHGRVTDSGPSGSFMVSEDNSLPDPRGGIEKFVEAAKPRFGKRTLVLMPDAVSAGEVASLLPGSQLVTAATGLESLAVCLLDQSSDKTYVSDDVCARGLNLNLDVLVDSQLITEHGVTRNITKAELHQRKHRVSRTRAGWYVNPGLPTIELHESEADVLRSNILRSIAGIEQYGPKERHVDEAAAEKLLCSPVEPITVHRFQTEVVAVQSSQSPTRVRETQRRKSKSSSGSGSSREVVMPGWMSWLVPSSAKEVIAGKSYYVSEGPEEYRAVSVKRHSRGPREPPGAEAALAVVPDAPYAVRSKTRRSIAADALSIPAMPPIVDLTELNYSMDWPTAIRDCLERGGDLPTIVPPGNWRHTSTGGMGTDWFARLEMLSVGELTFSESEMEVVCRAWNKMVAAAWVKRTPGLSSVSNEHRLEFCARYFQSYYQMIML